MLLGKVRVPTQSEYEKAVTDVDKEKVKVGDLNEEAFEDIVLSMNHTLRQGKVAKLAKGDDESNSDERYDELGF